MALCIPRLEGSAAPHTKKPPSGGFESSGGGTRTHNLPVNSRSLLPIELPRIVLSPSGYTGKKVAPSDDLDDTCLYLRVAVGTQKNAFGRLRLNGLERASQPPLREPELLQLAVPMVKLKSADTPVIAADAATPTDGRDEELLQFPAPAGNSLGAASETAVDAPSLEPELCHSVPEALHDLPVRIDTADPLRITPPSADRPQAVLPQPMPDRRLAQTEPRGDLPCRQAVVDQRSERPTVNPASWGVPVAVHG